jgi:type I restriction enzyme, S subunit
MKSDLLRLGDICEFAYGESLIEGKRKGGTIPVYGSNGIVGWHESAITKGPSIIIGRKGSIGEVHYCPGSCWPIDTTYYVRNTKKPCSIKWLYYLLLSLNLQKMNKSAAIPGLNRDDAYKKLVVYPSVTYQEQIVILLDAADSLCRKSRYSLELSETYLESVFMQMFGNCLYNSNSHFKEVLQIPLQNGIFEDNSNYGSGTPVIWVDNLYHTISIDISNLRRAKLVEKNINKYRVNTDDLLFTRSSLVREGVGQINIVPELSEITTFECHIIRARVNDKIVEPHYIWGLYRSSFGRKAILRRSNTATMTTIGQEAIKELPCPIPPLDIQKRFSNVFASFEGLLIQQRETARQAEHLFQTLLHKAFTGELSKV